MRTNAHKNIPRGLEFTIRYQLTRISLSSYDHFFSVQAGGASLKPPYHPGCEVHINPAPFPSLSLSPFFSSGLRPSMHSRTRTRVACSRLYSARTSLAGWLATYLNNISVMVMEHGNNGNNRVVTATKMGHCGSLLVPRHGVSSLSWAVPRDRSSGNTCLEPLVRAYTPRARAHYSSEAGHWPACKSTPDPCRQRLSEEISRKTGLIADGSSPDFGSSCFQFIYRAMQESSRRVELFTGKLAFVIVR